MPAPFIGNFPEMCNRIRCVNAAEKSPLPFFYFIFGASGEEMCTTLSSIRARFAAMQSHSPDTQRCGSLGCKF